MALTTCSICGRKLFQPESVKRDIEPACLARLGCNEVVSRELKERNPAAGENRFEPREEELKAPCITGDDCIKDPLFCENCLTMLLGKEEALEV